MPRLCFLVAKRSRDDERGSTVLLLLYLYIFSLSTTLFNCTDTVQIYSPVYSWTSTVYENKHQ